MEATHSILTSSITPIFNLLWISSFSDSHPFGPVRYGAQSTSRASFDVDSMRYLETLVDLDDFPT